MLCLGWKQKCISLRSWEKGKHSLTIQGGFCVPKVYIREKPYERFSTTLLTSQSPESRGLKIPSGTHDLRIYLE